MDLSTAWIHGRTLAKFLNKTNLKHSFGKFSLTDQVKIKLPHDLYAIGVELEYPTPFVVDNNLLITAHDIDRPSAIIDLCNIRFTENAFKSAADYLMSSTSTEFLELLGEQIFEDSKKILEFSESVCKWGDGKRVWGNLNRYYKEESQLEAKLAKWLTSAKNNGNVYLAISEGTEIKGLGVSFASKHLRHIAPNRFAVLDSVISEGLGYALNPAGYNFFISDLHHLQRNNFPDFRIADIEGGLFFLVRQIVRGKTKD